MQREQYLGFWVVNWCDSQGIWWVGARRIGKNCNDWRKRHCVDLEQAKAWVRETVGVAEADDEPAPEREPEPTAEQWRVFNNLMDLAVAQHGAGAPADVLQAFGALHLAQPTKDQGVIKAAYRKMAKVWHPDGGGDEG